ncbi:MAG: HAMP domain-containing sensor histidine kinase [Bacillota bacterium]
MKRNILKASGYKRLWILMLFLIISTVIISWLCIDMLYRDLKTDLINKNISAMGSLLDSHPYLEADIVDAFTAEASAKAIETGIKAAEKYGYDKDTPVPIVPVIGVYRIKLLYSVSGLVMLGCILIFLVHYLYHKRIEKRVELIAEAAERIVEGEYGYILPEANEGSFAKLSHQFNQMSRILEANMEKVKRERVLLKNIISDISHQLKTPLSSLKMFNELLLEDEVDIHIQKQFYEKSGQQLERMEWLIKNLLKMARIEAGAIEFQKNTNIILHTIGRIIEDFDARIKEKRLDVSIVCNKPDISFKYDENWMKEAISNIIKNAVEHSTIGGRIVIEEVETPIMIRLVVSDNGEGINEEDLPHIFERFYKGRNSCNDSSTGIGLALAKAIIESHDGIITAKSKEGAGAAFIITFPKGVI